MEEQTTPSPEYLKGFNEGYLLAKGTSSLGDKLASVKGDSERMKGFNDGRRQHIVEKVKEQRNTYAKEHMAKGKEHSDRDKNKDIDIER